jgi:hypothetical protein
MKGLLLLAVLALQARGADHPPSVGMRLALRRALRLSPAIAVQTSVIRGVVPRRSSRLERAAVQ